MRATTLLLLPILFVFTACATHTIRVPVLVPAPVNLVQYDVVAVDRFHGDGCEPFSNELAEALGGAVNPMTGQRGFQVLHRKDVDQAHIRTCQQRLERLTEQRGDLAGCLERLLAEAARGESYFKVYRQFKMYNDPKLNPAVYGEMRGEKKRP